MKIFVVMLVAVSLVGCSSKSSDEGENQTSGQKVSASIPLQMCDWMAGEKLIADSRGTFDTLVFDTKRKGDVTEINAAVRLSGSCDSFDPQITIGLVGDYYYETTGALYSRSNHSYAIRITSAGVTESVWHSGYDIWKPSSQRENYNATYQRAMSLDVAKISVGAGVLVVELSGDGAFVTSRSGANLGYSPFARDAKETLSHATTLVLGTRAKTWQLSNTGYRSVYSHFERF